MGALRGRVGNGAEGEDRGVSWAVPRFANLRDKQEDANGLFTSEPPGLVSRFEGQAERLTPSRPPGGGMPRSQARVSPDL